MWILTSLTVLLTLAAVVVYANLKPADPVLRSIPELRHTVRSPQFRYEISSLFNQAVVGGNRIETLNNGVEIFPAMLEAILAAERSITFETYIYWRGDIARAMAEALADRARQGVRVHVILDWAGSRPMEPELVTLMEEAGVEVRSYRPLSWYHVDRLNNRTHRKILVVDGRVGFTGGVGIAEEWTGNAEDPEHYRDMHYRVTGPVVGQLQAAFAANWSRVDGALLSGADYFPRPEVTGDLPAQLISSTPGNAGESARALFLTAIAVARESLSIGTAYFVPDDLVAEALCAAARRGVRVRILVPGETTDSDLSRYASRRRWQTLLGDGIEIYEYDRTFYHAKLMVVDGYWSLVGSTNFDTRSFRLNDEVNLSVLSEEFARRQLEIYQRDLQVARPVHPRHLADRPLVERLYSPVAALLESQL